MVRSFMRISDPVFCSSPKGMNHGKYVNHLPLPLPACHALIDIVSHLFPNPRARLSGFVVNEVQPLPFSPSMRVLSFQRTKLHRAVYITLRVQTLFDFLLLNRDRRERESYCLKLFLEETLECGEHKVIRTRMRIDTCRWLKLGV